MLLKDKHQIVNIIRKIYAKELKADTSLLFQKIINIPNTTSFLTLCFAFVILFLLSMGKVDADEVKEIAPGIYLRPGIQEDFSKTNHGHIANIGFIVGKERVAVIDTGTSLQEGMALRQMIKNVTELPIEYVIFTHMHPDHVLGAAAFKQDNPVFIGHTQLEDALARRQSTYLDNMKRILGSTADGTEMIFPTQVVSIEQGLRLDLGGRWLQLTAYPTAHTNNDLSIYDNKTATLWFSDLLFVDRIPVVDGSLLGWIKVIDKLMQDGCLNRANSADKIAQTASNQGDIESCKKVERVVPGHGPVVTQWQAALAKQRRYFERMASDIREIIKKGGTISYAVEHAGLDERSKWLLFDQYHGRNVTAAFAELEWE